MFMQDVVMCEHSNPQSGDQGDMRVILAPNRCLGVCWWVLIR